MKFLNPNSTKKAVAYYRHSAEDKQENSVPIQREHAQLFAAKFNIQIIHEESDEGVSGLTANRPGFQSLLNNWVLNPDAPHFDFILVYDVSRWGRFQNQNEAAHYEHQCEQNDKKVIYISRGFPREGQEMTESIITPMERWMAAQYSRQLSEKVWYGCIRVSKDGYSAGGTASYGMARLLLDEMKNPIGILKKGQHKLISNQRVTFTPLNDETTQTVKDIFHFFLREWKTPQDIAEVLNERGILSANGKQWSRDKVLRILGNEVYTGSRVYNKTWSRLKQKQVENPRSEWVITPNAFPAVVDPKMFWEAQERLYWLMPSRWKKGICSINKAKRLVEQEIKELFTEKGLSEDDIEKEIKKIPITYSVSFQQENKPYRCFVVKEEMRNYKDVFAVSIALGKTEPIDRIFLIPSDEFNGSNFMVFSETDESFVKYQIDNNKVHENILSLIHK